MELDIHKLVLDNAYVQGGTLSGDRLELTVRDVLEEDEAVCFDSVSLVISGFSVLRAESVSRKALGAGSTVKQVKGRQLYKSELADFSARLTGEEWDVVSFDISRQGTVSFTLCFGDGGLFSFTARCSDISAVSQLAGKKVSKYGKGSHILWKFSRFVEKILKKTSDKKH